MLGPYKNLALGVTKREAETAVRALHGAGLLDPTRKIAQGDEVLIPVRGDRGALEEWAARLGARLVVDPGLAPREERPTPYAQVLARLAPELHPFAPDKWEKLGDVVVLRLHDAPHPGRIAAAYADALDARCIILDRSGVSGELREMQGEILYGADPVTTHLENGIRYRFDASRIMFSSGNVAERARTIDAPGETIVDMFAGIGYFTIPLALKSGASHIIALEKNPVSFQYLRENIMLNRVASVVDPWLGDNRDHMPEGIADRVLMGYFPGTAAFLPKALALLKPEGGVVHYHDTAHADHWRDEMTRAFLSAARACGRVVAIQEARVVKSYAPGVVHAVLVARVASRS